MPPPFMGKADGRALALPLLILLGSFTLRGALSFLMSPLKARFTGRGSAFLAGAARYEDFGFADSLMTCRGTLALT